MPSAKRHATHSQSYHERSHHPHNTPLATYLLQLMHIKRTNLCVSADVTSTAELLRLADEVGDHVCVLKTHADIVHDFSDKTVRGLEKAARRRKFVIFEDRKFGDIGNTVQQQYTGGPLCIARWAPIVNAHMFPGPGIITALAQAAQKAIASHNTSVQTNISASPAPSMIDSGNDNDSAGRSAPSISGGEEEEGETEEEEEEEEEEAEEEEEDEDEDEVEERNSRKQSVVSVSTTISTKTETFSPQPPSLRARLPDSPSSEESEDRFASPPDRRTAARLEELGPPPFQRSLLLLAEMSSQGNLLTADYTAACVRQARANRDFVMGFIAQHALNDEPEDNFVTMTPGVQLASAAAPSSSSAAEGGADGLGQQYNSPTSVVADAGCDIIIVGRGVLGAADRRAAALEYRKQGWMAYEQRLRAGKRKG